MHTRRYPSTPSHGPNSQPLTPRLQLLFTEQLGFITAAPVALGRGEMHIGRESVGFPLDDAYASREHAAVSTHGQEIVISDNGSLNGTFVNSQRIYSATTLRDGDIIRIGSSAILFTMKPNLVDTQAIDSIIGESLAISELRRDLFEYSADDATLLLRGEIGAGKELAAQVLHRLSGRSGSFVAINCGAIPRELADGVLFGSVRGAYTGAHRDTIGYFQAADRGTLFLDEIGELPQELQIKLLRALAEKTIMPLGATRAFSVDVRVIAATNRDLLDDVQSRAFRADLYSRIANTVIKVPSLRTRREDILPLLRYFWIDWGLGEPFISVGTVEKLLLYNWPFNVRELKTIAENLRKHGGARGYEQIINESLLDQTTVGRIMGIPQPTPTPTETTEPKTSDRGWHKRRPSNQELRALLQEHRGVLNRIAPILDVSRRQLKRWILDFGIDLEAYRRSYL